MQCCRENDYIKESKSLRNAIKKSVGTYAGLSGSSVVRSESLTDEPALVSLLIIQVLILILNIQTDRIDIMCLIRYLRLLGIQ